MKTDIERLHDMIDQLDYGPYPIDRRKGKTFSQCHKLAGYLAVEGCYTIIIEISFYEDMEYLFPMIFDIFEEHKIKITKRDVNTLFALNKKIIFYTERNFYDKTRGLLKYLYLSMKR